MVQQSARPLLASKLPIKTCVIEREGEEREKRRWGEREGEKVRRKLGTKNNRSLSLSLSLPLSLQLASAAKAFELQQRATCCCCRNKHAEGFLPDRAERCTSAEDLTAWKSGYSSHFGGVCCYTTSCGTSCLERSLSGSLSFFKDFH